MLSRELFTWGVGLWLAAGLEAAMGAGFPGPLLLIAIAAGLSSGTIPGMVVGALAGLCCAALGGHLLLCTVFGIICGVASSLIAKYFSNRNIIVAISTSAILTVVAAMIVCSGSGLSFIELMKFAGVRGGINALLMFPLYGIVLLLSSQWLHPSKLL